MLVAKMNVFWRFFSFFRKESAMILKKIAFFVISFILLFTLTVGCDQAPQKETSKETPTPQNTDTSKSNSGTSSNEEWQAVTIKVSGMT